MQKFEVVECEDEKAVLESSSSRLGLWDLMGRVMVEVRSGLVGDRHTWHHTSPGVTIVTHTSEPLSLALKLVPPLFYSKVEEYESEQVEWVKSR